MGRPLLRTPELAERFVAETLTILECDGIDAITTRAVAGAAESSLAALNELFGSRAGLINAVALRGFEVIRAELDQTLVEGDPRDDVIRICETYRRIGTQRPRLLDLMFSRPYHQFNPGPDDLEVSAAIQRHFTDRLAALMEMPAKSPVVIDAAVGLIALLQGLAEQERGGILGSSQTSTIRRWHRVIDFYLDGATDCTTA